MKWTKRFVWDSGCSLLPLRLYKEHHYFPGGTV